MKLTKDIRNGWTAESCIELGDERVLTITTMKRWNGSLSTTASVQTRSYTCGIPVLTFKMGRGGDFHRTILAEQIRATEKAVRTQHEQALGHLSTIKGQALEHYAETAAA